MEKKGVDNFKRRTWDKEVYQKKAEMRARGELEDQTTKNKVISNKEEFRPAEEGAAGPVGSARAFIRSRENKVELESGIGVTSTLAKAPSGEVIAGYYCEVCEATLKDSATYLDHINGKRHQRKLGFSMRTERSTVEQVKDRLQSIQKKNDIPISSESTIAEYEKRLRFIEEEEKRIKEEKKKEKKLQKEQQKEQQKEDQMGQPEQQPDQAMMAMLGFSGFGTSKQLK